METLRKSIESELLGNILPFWLKYGIDPVYGGFRGQVSNDLVINERADKGLILNARILWTFAKVYSVYGEEQYLDAARRAYDYLAEHFRDKEFDGVYWMLDCEGKPSDDKKRIYGQAFTIYALAEYYKVTHDEGALEFAIKLFHAVEQHSHDAARGGYGETYDRDWKPSANQQLSEVDMDTKRSMNTHLHVMEAYATLLTVWPDVTLRARLAELIQIFLKRIVNPANHHMLMFFDDDWKPQSKNISFGHDIEASWLLVEAAEILGDKKILARVKEESVKMAAAVLDEAIDPDGGLLYESDGTTIHDTGKEWWPQAEALVGFLNAYQLSGNKRFLDAAQKSWEFIDTHIVDHVNGEWFWKVTREGVVSNEKFKLDAWKCPYHNSRACMEAMARLAKF